ncbi:MAG: hypothetical protein RIE77_07755 [Phycisphaerales bacterium]|jgi:flagellum-specific peptidoglycan hydrolase FlgJ
MWQWIQNNFGIIIIALSFGISGLGWLLQQLKSAQEKKQADSARQKAKLEALRTGRVETPQPQPVPGATQPRVPQQETPRERLEELARRRQQEQQQRAASKRQDLEEQLRRRREAIEAQRRRQQEQQQQRQQRSRPQPQQPQRSQQQRTPAQRPSNRGAQRDRPRPIPATRPADPTQAPVQQTVITDVIAAKRRAENRPVEAPIAVGGRNRSAPLTARGIDLKQAIIMREIFDRPVGFRTPGDQLF